MIEIRKPCRSCPWRVDQHADAIPSFRLDLAERLAPTCPDEHGFGPDFGDPMFACHQSTPDEEVVCAGWLASCGSAHPHVRLAIYLGQIPSEALKPGHEWPELHATFADLIAKLRHDCNHQPGALSQRRHNLDGGSPDAR